MKKSETTEQTEQYPIEGRGSMVDADMIEAYLRRLFGNTFYKPHNFINFRGIGEKGTPREGAFQEDCWVQPGVVPKGFDGDDLMIEDAAKWARVWAAHDVAAYVVPAVLNQARGSAEAVESFPAVVVDLDSGDTLGKSAFLKEHLGPPTMAVASGGNTAEGKPKLHLYWVLEAPCSEVGRVVDVRHEIAVKAGGDLSMGRGVEGNPYGRAHQPIRVPGSVHCKGGNPAPVRLLADREDCVYDIDVLAESVRRMPRSPWALDESAAAAGKPGSGVPMGFGAFSPDATWGDGSGVGDALTTEIHEGGEARTRWGEFNKVAGFMLAEVRRGNVAIEAALDQVKGWVLNKMVPPWPEARVEREWRALLAKDEGEKGAMPAAVVAPKGGIVRDESLGLREWAAHRTMTGETPRRRFLVDGLLLEGKPHLLVAEGGAGKTFAMLDLCTKVATRHEGEEMSWLGQRVLCETGTVVMLTTEDDIEELHIRMDSIDRERRRREAGDRLIIVPAVNTERGPFAFVERDKITGAAVPSPGFREFAGWLSELPDLRLVVVDTLNTTMHGEENSATVVNEYARTLAPICGKLGAALIVTHHIRKADSKFPVETAEDMFNAVRGSSALPAAFRAVIGLWHSNQWGKVLPAMGMQPKPKLLWNMAVLKANNPEMVDGTRVLLRGTGGGLEDVTERATGALGGEDAQLRAWLVAAVRCAAEGGDPYLDGGKSAPGGLYGRRSELPSKVRGLGRVKLLALVEGLVDEGLLVGCEVDRKNERGSYRRCVVLEVRGGRYDVPDPERVDPIEAGWVAPDWDAEWGFDPATGEVIPSGAPRMKFGGKADA